ncbi:MAG: SDR family NAD(P)-dependent oxidoreductase [Bacteroidota bacterium]|nr:SDR family NAD(P)-dependent oxidoreductase [Bacteroidota bacterium]MEC8032544.1 SDR family NAD(P)-dependent oxidoreductase [Bacteroidota bacterium]MEC9221077.1 SDR family NAD(P)-dependent oxidoreductase [Bacteroidota bacterium]
MHAVITGANDGIGLETAKGLAKLGYNQTWLCRNLDKANKASKDILLHFPMLSINIIQVDLASLASVKNAALQVIALEQEIDVLLCNAGGTFSHYTLTEDGVEKTMAVNHLSHFLLCHLLLDHLNPKARIVHVSSRANLKGKLSPEELKQCTAESDPKYYIMAAYRRSKLANVVYTKYSAALWSSQGITVNCLHPGVVKTKIGHKSDRWLHQYAWALLSNLQGISVEEGARTSIYLASDPDVASISGQYFDSCKVVKANPISDDGAIQEALYEWSLNRIQRFI